MAESAQGRLPRVFLDTCVLFPQLVRELIFATARRGLFTPLWSPRVGTEWRIAAARNGGIAAEVAVDDLLTRMRETFPEGEVAPSARALPDLALPDDADRHVVAGALAGGADAILTFNLRDFPARRLAPLGLGVRHPDGFFWQLFGEQPSLMRAAVAEALGAAGVEPGRGRAAFKRARLSRFAKAWAAEAVPN